MRLEPGLKIGTYEIVGALGTGGMGEVYRAGPRVSRRGTLAEVLARGPMLLGQVLRIAI